ncbi:unnamed protein product [Chrysodeixis includens]|uniref:Uncharacterized protein n=1 Tax=Chrysodeixis includens TaxID=689277 RepID=A0A9P0FRD5_CHRIL|nr:unnamed protein product [Chrysodeixis includens]
MRAVILFCLIVAAVSARPQQYTNKYDNVNLSEILSNKRLLIPYLKCTLDQGKCSPDGKELKSHIKEALENYCAKCTNSQRDGTRRVISHLIHNEPDYWKQLSKKYDPQGKYASKYERELRSL